ncbi:hypothetical protein AB5I41_07425 [Sphingomonas sp. MMS24-JH45]
MPLVRLDLHGARALNRAARAIFATDERILPFLPPSRIGRAVAARGAKLADRCGGAAAIAWWR